MAKTVAVAAVARKNGCRHTHLLLLPGYVAFYYEYYGCGFLADVEDKTAELGETFSACSRKETPKIRSSIWVLHG